MSFIAVGGLQLSMPVGRLRGSFYFRAAREQKFVPIPTRPRNKFFPSPPIQMPVHTCHWRFLNIEAGVIFLHYHWNWIRKKLQAPDDFPFATGDAARQHHGKIRLHFRLSFASPRESRIICFHPAAPRHLHPHSRVSL